MSRRAGQPNEDAAPALICYSGCATLSNDDAACLRADTYRREKEGKRHTHRIRDVAREEDRIRSARD